ncbi:MAG: hypothetical protein GX627_03110 [Parcubacteria group bacterium]|nr:hypothetical protein [Parcubacteria group bacterium]
MEEEYIKTEEFEEVKTEGWRSKIEVVLTGKYFVPLIIILVAVIGFSLGRISGLQDKKMPVRIISGEEETKGVLDKTFSGQQGQVGVEQPDTTMNSTMVAGAVVASKNGTKYHYPWCAGAKQISAKNLITFSSIEEARKAGYTPASNCKGLK